MSFSIIFNYFQLFSTIFNYFQLVCYDFAFSQVLQSLLRKRCGGNAFLDVFEEEPLPIKSFIWNHKKIHITPHIASITNVKAVIPQVVKNYKRLLDGKNLSNLVDTNRMY